MTDNEQIKKEYYQYLKENSEQTQTLTTNCKDCVFAVYDNNIQVYCKIDRLFKFKNKHHIKDEESGQTHYIIGRICNTCRSPEWAANRTNIVEDVQNEVLIQCDFLLLSFDDDPGVAIQKICDAALICVNQNIKPKSIFVIVKNFNINYQLLHDKIQEITKDIEYKLIRITDTSAELLPSVDRTVKRCKGQYYITIDTTTNPQIPHDLLDKINEAINNQLRTIICIDSTDFTFSQRKIHLYLDGNKLFTLREKVQMLSDIQNNKSSIVNWNDL